MKKILLATLAVVCWAFAAEAQLKPYVGFDYVNMTPNLRDSLPDNYDIGNINAGVAYSDWGALEIFAERSMREKRNVGNDVTRGRLYGYGADLLVNGFSFSQGAILGSVGYGRITAKTRDAHANKEEKGNALRLGFGGEINPTLNWGFRAMFRYSLADSDAFKNAKEFAIGARYYFY